MALTAHKTVTMFMRYVHTEDNPIRAAAEMRGATGSGDFLKQMGSETAAVVLRSIINREWPLPPDQAIEIAKGGGRPH